MTTRTDTYLKQFPPETHSWAGKVTIGFSYPYHGWIQFVVTATTYVQNVIVKLSNVFDPFPELIRWLETIAEGNLPNEFVIDEEGVEKIFRAIPVNGDEFIFEIVELLYGEDKSEEEPIFLYVQVTRKQFLSEFLKRWDDFLENQYDPAQWEERRVPSLRELDVSKIREFVEG